MLIRLVADLIVNHFTTIWFLQDKTVDPEKYKLWCSNTLSGNQSHGDVEEIPLCEKTTSIKASDFDEENVAL